MMDRRAKNALGTPFQEEDRNMEDLKRHYPTRKPVETTPLMASPSVNNPYPTPLSNSPSTLLKSMRNPRQSERHRKTPSTNTLSYPPAFGADSPITERGAVTPNIVQYRPGDISRLERESCSDRTEPYPRGLFGSEKEVEGEGMLVGESAAPGAHYKSGIVLRPGVPIALLGWLRANLDFCPAPSSSNFHVPATPIIQIEGLLQRDQNHFRDDGPQWSRQELINGIRTVFPGVKLSDPKPDLQEPPIIIGLAWKSRMLDEDEETDDDHTQVDGSMLVRPSNSLGFQSISPPQDGSIPSIVDRQFPSDQRPNYALHQELLRGGNDVHAAGVVPLGEPFAEDKTGSARLNDFADVVARAERTPAKQSIALPTEGVIDPVPQGRHKRNGGDSTDLNSLLAVVGSIDADSVISSANASRAPKRKRSSAVDPLADERIRRAARISTSESPDYNSAQLPATPALSVGMATPHPAVADGYTPPNAIGNDRKLAPETYPPTFATPNPPKGRGRGKNRSQATTPMSIKGKGKGKGRSSTPSVNSRQSVGSVDGMQYAESSRSGALGLSRVDAMSEDGSKAGCKLKTEGLQPGVDHCPDEAYAVSIYRVIEASPYRRLRLQGIYKGLMDMYPYYATLDKQEYTSLTNSIRHNLSLHSWAFRVKPKTAITDLHPEEEEGKGGYWHIVDNVTIENLVKKGSKKNASRPSGRKSKASAAAPTTTTAVEGVTSLTPTTEIRAPQPTIVSEHLPVNGHVNDPTHLQQVLPRETQ